MDFGFSQPSVSPNHRHFESAAGPQAAYRSVGPGLGKRRQQVYLSGVALEQHLGDPGRRSEIAVDLEGRVSVQQIGVHAAPGGSAPPEVDRRQELLQAFVRLFAIEQTRPKVHLPGQAPARPFVGAESNALRHAAQRAGSERQVICRPGCRP